MKNGTKEITRTMMCKLRRRHFTKLEAMQWKVDTYERCYKYRSAKLTMSHHKWHLNKCEAAQEINHMQDANNITLPS